jgi:hypothetical protein
MDTVQKQSFPHERKRTELFAVPKVDNWQTVRHCISHSWHAFDMRQMVHVIIFYFPWYAPNQGAYSIWVRASLFVGCGNDKMVLFFFSWKYWQCTAVTYISTVYFVPFISSTIDSKFQTPKNLLSSYMVLIREKKKKAEHNTFFLIKYNTCCKL